MLFRSVIDNLQDTLRNYAKNTKSKRIEKSMKPVVLFSGGWSKRCHKIDQNYVIFTNFKFFVDNLKFAVLFSGGGQKDVTKLIKIMSFLWISNFLLTNLKKYFLAQK